MYRHQVSVATTNSRKKCDEQYPTCGRCKLRNGECKWPEKKVKKKTSSRETRASSVPANSGVQAVTEEIKGFKNDLAVFQMEIEGLRGSAPTDAAEPYIPLDLLLPSSFTFMANLDEDGLMFINFYRETYSPFMSIGLELLNYFLKTFLGLAATSESITYALAAWGGFYLELRKPRADFTRPWAYMQKAAKSMCTQLGGMLQPCDKLEFFVLFAFYLIFIGIEVSTGDVRNWGGFMTQCTQLVRSFGGLSAVARLFDHSNDIRWLINDFLFHDVLSSRALNRGTTFPIAEYQAAVAYDSSYGIDPLIGIVGPLYNILGDIGNCKAHLSGQWAAVEELVAAGDANAGALRAKYYDDASAAYDEFSARIDACGPEQVHIDLLQLADDQDLHMTLFELYLCVVRMQLATSIMKLAPNTIPQQRLVVKSLALIDALLDTKLKVSLSLLILVCGMNCCTAVDREHITGQFRLHMEQYQMGNFQRVEETVLEAWECNPDGNLCIDWADLVKQKGWNLYVG